MTTTHELEGVALSDIDTICGEDFTHREVEPGIIALRYTGTGFAPIPLFSQASNRIVNEVRGVRRAVLDISQVRHD